MSDLIGHYSGRVLKASEKIAELQGGINSRLIEIAEIKNQMYSDQDELAFHRYGPVQEGGGDLIGFIRSWNEAPMFRCETSSVIADDHNNKPRTLVPCPSNFASFSTSALDGYINFWQLQEDGNSILTKSIHGETPGKKYPTDVAWHPVRTKLLLSYGVKKIVNEHGVKTIVDDAQIAIMRPKKTRTSPLTYLTKKPHTKSINRILVMPWEGGKSFISCGADKKLVMWTVNAEKKWSTQELHSRHTSGVTGVATTQDKYIPSVGLDRRLVGHSLEGHRDAYITKEKLGSRCFNILSNPIDPNLFLVQTSAPNCQISLVDKRLVGDQLNEVASMGWNQQQTDTQSTLITQSWSPDGIYILSGSADPLVHVFDIRYVERTPVQSIGGHSNRVFKAIWLSTPLEQQMLASISSDHKIGLHQINHY